MSRSFEVAPTAIESALEAGMVGAVQERVARMAKLATPCKHTLGNRRYGHYVLYVKEGVVLTVSKMVGESDEDRAGLNRMLDADTSLSDLDRRVEVKAGRLTKEEVERALNKFRGNMP